MKSNLFFLLLILLLNACMYAEQPFYTEQDISEPPGMEGKWLIIEKTPDRQEKTFITVQKVGKDYLFISQSENEKSKKANTPDSTNAHFFKLENQLFLDVLDTRSDSTGKEIQCHLLYKIEVKKNKVMLSSWSEEFFKKKIEEKTLELPYREEEGKIIITASTSELQNFIRNNLKNKDFFQKGGEMKKVE